MNTHETGAGVSRRSRRLALTSATLVTIAGALLLTIGGGNADDDVETWTVFDQTFSRTDAEIAAHVLSSVAGANDVVCAAIGRAFDAGNWGESLLLTPDATVSPDAVEAARWIGKRKLDRATLAVARPALSGGDPCTRRVAARIAGAVAVSGIEQELRAELAADAAPTRAAAALALGYAEQTTSVPRLRELLNDPDRTVRLAAIWALGSVEGSDAVSALVPLLEASDAGIRLHAVWALGRIEDASPSEAIATILGTDGDPEVRRAAAWALGRMHD